MQNILFFYKINICDGGKIKKMKKLDVLYTVDNNYIDMCLGSILSLIQNGNINDLRIHVITSGFNIEDYHKMEDMSISFAKSFDALYFKFFLQVLLLYDIIIQ